MIQTLQLEICVDVDAGGDASDLGVVAHDRPALVSPDQRTRRRHSVRPSRTCGSGLGNRQVPSWDVAVLAFPCHGRFAPWRSSGRLVKRVALTRAGVVKLVDALDSKSSSARSVGSSPTARTTFS